MRINSLTPQSTAFSSVIPIYKVYVPNENKNAYKETSYVQPGVFNALTLRLNKENAAETNVISSIDKGFENSKYATTTILGVKRLNMPYGLNYQQRLAKISESYNTYDDYIKDDDHKFVKRFLVTTEDDVGFLERYRQKHFANETISEEDYANFIKKVIIKNPDKRLKINGKPIGLAIYCKNKNGKPVFDYVKVVNKYGDEFIKKQETKPYLQEDIKKLQQEEFDFNQQKTELPKQTSIKQTKKDNSDDTKSYYQPELF